jgi:DNA-binding CsgD family transcriptional regulator/tetratricopeptide (TPR) repeat protein
MTVQPLSVDAVRHLVDGSGRDVAMLHRLTGGNPFFLTEVLASEDTRVPASVGDAVLARAARLSPEARAMLDVASVIGGAIDVDLLQRIAGPVLDEADECVARGLLRWDDDGLSFRHALAREAILAVIAPPRRRLLHARVLAALVETAPSSGGGLGGVPPETEGNLALLAHHAEAAGDREAVLQFAIPAAEQAATMHAYREAAAQYARALRFGDSLPGAERARLFEGRSLACHLSDQGEEAFLARRAALGIWRSLGNPLREGDNLRWLSRLSWYAGRGAEAEEAATAALAVLEPLPPGPELAMAYSNLAQLRMLADDLEGTLLWGRQAIELAQRLGETETLIHALTNVGTARQNAGDEGGAEELTQSLQLALDGGFVDHAGRAMSNLAWDELWSMRLDEANRRLETATNFAIEHDLDFYRWYFLATRATVRARQGTWDLAEEEVRQVLRQPALSPLTRIVALTTLGQVLARRGSPEAAEVLDEVLALAERTGQLIRLIPIRTARAEAALLADDHEQARAEALEVRDVIFSGGDRWQKGEIAWLQWKAGASDVPTDLKDLAEPYALQFAGNCAEAASAWQALGCPYEAARALAESDDPALLRQASGIFEQLGSQPALSQAARRLRALGVRDVPAVRRGPYSSTRANPAGLTRRETEVLALLADGLRNSDIADRLYMTPKTVSHHITAILGKLGVETRVEAAREAMKLGITSEN